MSPWYSSCFTVAPSLVSAALSSIWNIDCGARGGASAPDGSAACSAPGRSVARAEQRHALTNSSQQPAASGVAATPATPSTPSTPRAQATHRLEDVHIRAAAQQPAQAREADRVAVALHWGDGGRVGLAARHVGGRRKGGQGWCRRLLVALLLVPGRLVGGDSGGGALGGLATAAAAAAVCWPCCCSSCGAPQAVPVVGAAGAGAAGDGAARHSRRRRGGAGCVRCPCCCCRRRRDRAAYCRVALAPRAAKDGGVGA